MAQGDVNVTLVGNITADPELRFTPSGAAVANFTVVTNTRVLDKATNEWRDGDPSFWRCSVWRQYAENVAESLTRGTRVIVTGRLVQRDYEKDGVKHRVTEVQVDDVGPVLRYATAKVAKVTRSDNASGSADAGWGTSTGAATGPDPWRAQDVEPPF
jgi:single-strand DNA-binding protein